MSEKKGKYNIGKAKADAAKAAKAMIRSSRLR